jgi:hypothetical protein
MEIDISKSKACKKCGEVKTFDLFTKSSTTKSGVTANCRVCHLDNRKESYQRNKVQAAKYQVKYKAENKEAVRANAVRYEEENKKIISIRKHNYYQENKEAISLVHSEYRNNNKDKINALQAKRRAAKLQAIPCWFSELDDFVLSEAYSHAKHLEELTGVKYHVDHIVPLQGNLVSGLHCADNIQVITATENLTKSNKWEI